MTITELIAKLTELRESYGDMNVQVSNGGCGCCELIDVVRDFQLWNVYDGKATDVLLMP